MISPTVGRAVLFVPFAENYSFGYSLQAGKRYAAIVACVHGDRMVNLCVFDANGKPFAKTSVTLRQPEDPVPMSQDYCEWLLLPARRWIAPVPPPPKELTPAMLVGTWRYECGLRTGAVIVFGADGNFMVSEPEDGSIFHGTWRIEAPNVLVLNEELLCPELEVSSGPVERRMVLELKGYPYLVGAEGTNRIVLRDPKR